MPEWQDINPISTWSIYAAKSIQPKFTDPRPLAERPLMDANDKKLPLKSARMVTVNLAESPLSWLHARGHLTDRQFLAGEKLRRDYEVASLEPSVTMRWDNAPVARNRSGAPDGLNQTERMISAKARFDGALAAIGLDLSDIAWHVVCAGEGIAVAERGMAWPVRSGKLVLRIALDRLAGYYRLSG